MRDGCGRTIDYLRLSVTDRCNYRCRYCMPEAGVEKRAHADILSLEELAEIAAAAVACGVKKIRLTGGEPLVRRGLVDLCRMLRAIPGVEELCLTTNGSLLPKLAAPLRDAGLDRLNISLDTLRVERFAAMTRLGTLRDVLDGIKAAEAAGFHDLKFDTVLIGGFNDGSIPGRCGSSSSCPWGPAPPGTEAASCWGLRCWSGCRSWRPSRPRGWPGGTSCRAPRARWA